MFLLLFVILIIQFFNYWIFVPLTSFLTYVLEIRFSPVFSIIVFILLFSAKNTEKY